MNTIRTRSQAAAQAGRNSKAMFDGGAGSVLASLAFIFFNVFIPGGPIRIPIYWNIATVNVAAAAGTPPVSFRAGRFGIDSATLRELIPFALFPFTQHVESVALFEARGLEIAG